jgi:tRNA-dihydrouridine synthase
MLPLRIGAFTPAAPVVLAPMAGVTNEPFRAMCREHAPDLLYVNEMVMATAVVYRNDKTLRMMTFGPDELLSLQIYGSDRHARACRAHGVRRRTCRPRRPQLGCPAAKVTRRRRGSGAGRCRLLRASCAAVRGTAYGVPVKRRSEWARGTTCALTSRPA